MKMTAELQPVKPTGQRDDRLPALAVDLDETLVKTDLLVESILALVRRKPWCIFSLLVWRLKGKAYLKQQVARRVSLDVTVLPYRKELLDYLRTQRGQGRTLVLATAGDIQIAEHVAIYLNLFDRVLASDGTTNLLGESKRNRLVAEFGEKGFDYAGNDRRDLKVWASARKAIVVNPARLMIPGIARVAQVDRVFEDHRSRWGALFEALRLQQWLKNLLVFVPLLAAHRIGEVNLLWKLILAFPVFGCFASSGYLINDLLDLTADRHHPAKRSRPFASGNLPIAYGLRTIPALIVLGCLLGNLVSRLFLEVALIYLALSLTYSFYVKKIAVLDVIFLAGLYTVRIIAGSAATAVWPSHWLLAFSTFLFFSLALVKRYGELVIMRRIEGDRARARGYEFGDAELLAAMGISAGYLAVLVLALYINSSTARVLYGEHEVMWFLCPLLLYWISHMWLIAHRGRMPDDPLVFTIHDRTSRMLMLLMLATTALAL